MSRVPIGVLDMFQVHSRAKHILGSCVDDCYFWNGFSGVRVFVCNSLCATVNNLSGPIWPFRVNSIFHIFYSFSVTRVAKYVLA